MERNIDFLGKGNIERPDTPLHAALLGFRESIKKRLKIDKFPLIIHNDHKGAIKSLYGNNSYPFGYFRFPQISINTERFNLRNIGRHAIGYDAETISSGNAQVAKEYTIPINMNISCFYHTNQVEDASAFIQRLLILSASRKFDFEICIPNMQKWNVDIRLEGDISLPDTLEIDNEEMPMVFELPFSFKVESYISIVKEVPKINNVGAVTTSLTIGDEEV